MPEKNEKKLILHIGNHKTGTTSIQRSLYYSGDELKKAGYTYFSEIIYGIKKFNAVDWVDLTAFSQEYGGKIRTDFAKALSLKEGNVIVSVETMSWIFDEKEIESFYNDLRKYFTEITVLVYIRRQDKHVISHFQQAAKTLPSKVFFGKGNTAIPIYGKHLDSYFNYYVRLMKWVNIFGKENFIIRVFDKKYFPDGDVVCDFFNTLQLNIDYKKLQVNESNGFIKTKVLHLLKEKNFTRNHSKFLSQFLDNSGKLIPSRKEAEDFYNRYRDSNNKLNKEFGIIDDDSLFDDDFSIYPEKKSDIWNEEKSNIAFAGIFAAIKVKEIKKGTITKLEKLSDKLNDINADSSKEINHMLEHLKLYSYTKQKPGNSVMKKVKRAFRKVIRIFFRIISSFKKNTAFIHIGTFDSKHILTNSDIKRKLNLRNIDFHVLETDDCVLPMINREDGCRIKTNFIDKLKMNKSVFISAPDFIWLFNQNEIETLKTVLLEKFDKVKIQIDIERQDQYFLKQSNYINDNCDIFFMNNHKALPSNNSIYNKLLDFDKKVRMWCNVFGIENTKVVNMTGRSVFPIAKFIGIISSLNIISNKYSKNFYKAKFEKLEEFRNLSYKIRNEILSHFESDILFSPSKQEVKNFLNSYKKSNKSLNDFIYVTDNPYLFNDDLEMYDTKSTDEWNEYNVNSSVSKLLDFIDTMVQLDDNELKTLIEIAEACKVHNPDISLELARIVNSIYIKDKSVIKRIKEYKELIKLQQESASD